MNIASAQWPIRYEGLVAIRDLKIKAARSLGLGEAATNDFIRRAEGEFHASIGDEMRRRANHSGDATKMVES